MQGKFVQRKNLLNIPQIVAAAINGPAVAKVFVNSITWGARFMMYYLMLVPILDSFRGKEGIDTDKFDEVYAKVFSLAALVNATSFFAAYALTYFDFSAKTIQRAVLVTNLAAKGLKALGTFFSAGITFFSLYSVITGEKDFSDLSLEIFTDHNCNTRFANKLSLFVDFSGSLSPRAAEASAQQSHTLGNAAQHHRGATQQQDFREERMSRLRQQGGGRRDTFLVWRRTDITTIVVKTSSPSKAYPPAKKSFRSQKKASASFKKKSSPISSAAVKHPLQILVSGLKVKDDYLTTLLKTKRDGNLTAAPANQHLDHEFQGDKNAVRPGLCS
eukprot:gene25929-31314_t